MKDYVKLILFISFILLIWLSALYILNIMFEFPLLMNIGNGEYIPRAVIVFIYFHNCQKLIRKLTRKLKFKEKYETLL